jgi:peptide deformylase
MKPIDILIPDEFRVYFEQNDGVVKYPDPLLRKVAKPIQRITPDLEHLIEHMLQVMKRAKGIGLAAPQVGSPIRLIIVAPQDQKTARDSQTRRCWSDMASRQAWKDA